LTVIENRKFREGFVEPQPVDPATQTAPPAPPGPMPMQNQAPPVDVYPRDTPPQEPLPSQMKLDQPPPEPPLAEVDQIRRDIAAQNESWPVTVHLLYKPIRNNKNELVDKLVFREPKAADINRIGNPTRMLWDSEIVIEERKMTYIMAALAGVLPPMIDEMDPRDWNSCALRLRKFFLPDLRAW
jgi:hypothetical protein